MILNQLDTCFSKSKLRCVLMFLGFSVLFCACILSMMRCSQAILKYANSTDYMMLFEDSRVSNFFLGKIVFNAMEYLYAGKSFFWIIMKSLSVLDVVLVLMAVIILFQDPSSSYVQMMRVFTGFLVFLLVLFLGVYTFYLMLASVQLTSEAGFAQLMQGAKICEMMGLGALIMTFLMNIVLWLNTQGRE